MIPRIIKLIFCLALLTSSAAWAQYTTVTATVKDPAGNVYSGCSYSIDFVVKSSLPQLSLLNGSQFQTSFSGLRCNGNGVFTATLADNNQITPNDVPSNWRFSICAAAGTPCFSTQLLITGSSQNITTSIQAASISLPGTTFPFVSVSGITASTSITSPLATLGSVNGIFYVDGNRFNTVAAAINAACLGSGGMVVIPPGTYPMNSAPTLCSNLILQGAGQGQANGAGCATTITTTLTSGELFSWVNLFGWRISDLCIKNLGAAGTATGMRLSGSQHGMIENIYQSGPFLTQLKFDSSAAATQSTIWNKIIGFHSTGTAAGGTGCLFDSKDAVNKTINSNMLWDVICTGGAGGKGLWLTNTANLQIINENIINCTECTSSGGTAVQIDALSTQGLQLIALNAEGSSVGFNKATGNTVTFMGGNISSNATNIIDAQPAFTQMPGTRGTVQNYGLDASGNIIANGLSFGTAAISAGNINGTSPMTIQTSGNGAIQISNSSIAFGQPISGFTFTGPIVDGSDTPATTGEIRFGADTTVCWRNSANTADICYGQVQSKRGVAGCATAASIGAQCTTTITWPSAFADTAYTVAGCMANGVTSGVPFIMEYVSKTTTSIGVVTAAITAAAAQFTTIECHAVHD